MALAREAGVDLSPHVSPSPPGASEPTIVLPDGTVINLPAKPDGATR